MTTPRDTTTTPRDTTTVAEPSAPAALLTDLRGLLGYIRNERIEHAALTDTPAHALDDVADRLETIVAKHFEGDFTLGEPAPGGVDAPAGELLHVELPVAEPGRAPQINDLLRLLEEAEDRPSSASVLNAATGVLRYLQAYGWGADQRQMVERVLVAIAAPRPTG